MPRLNNFIWITFATYVVAVAFALYVVSYRSVQRRALFATMFAAVIGGFANVVYANAAWLIEFACTCAALLIAVWAIVDRRNDSARWLARGAGAIVLQPPFKGRWRVIAGGPNRRHNPNHPVSDQFYAYDFVYDDGDSWNQPILSPCRGLVSHVEDRYHDAEPNLNRRERRRYPLGNYVSVETPHGFVILASLQHASILVRPGAPVGIGEQIARCGKSGRRGETHFHIHAQETAFVDPGVARAIPIAFANPGSQPLLLEYGDIL